MNNLQYIVMNVKYLNNNFTIICSYWMAKKVDMYMNNLTICLIGVRNNINKGLFFIFVSGEAHKKC